MRTKCLVKFFRRSKIRPVQCERHSQVCSERSISDFDSTVRKACFKRRATAVLSWLDLRDFKIQRRGQQRERQKQQLV